MLMSAARPQGEGLESGKRIDTRTDQSRWVFRTKQGGYLQQRGPAGLGYEQALFPPYLSVGPPLRSGMGGNSGARIHSTFHVVAGEGAWKEGSLIWLLSYCLIFSNSHHVSWPLVLHL